MQNGKTGTEIPDWVPEGARHYLAHTERGQTIRALARQADVHASTILRQVRRIEQLRDDPLVDHALRRLSERCGTAADDGRIGAAAMAADRAGPSFPAAKAVIAAPPAAGRGQDRHPPAAPSGEAPVPDGDDLDREGLRILRRLAEPGTVLAVARDMEMGVVVRDGRDGDLPQRLAVVARAIAEAMALNDWIACDSPEARVARYRITGAGRAALRRLAAQAGGRGPGLSESQANFAGAQVEDPALRHMRTLLAESPLIGLARRHDRDGQPFLGRDLVAAAERLREDFELSDYGQPEGTDWEGFLSAIPADRRAAAPSGRPLTPGVLAARDRLDEALSDLGPGLADVALRCCCLLEGLETLERRMGWSARSGKIVLRIALQRLQHHYLRTQGRFGPMIG